MFYFVLCARERSAGAAMTRDVPGSFVTADGLWRLPPFLAAGRGRVQMSPLPLAGPRERVSECSSCVRGSVHRLLGASNPVTFRNEGGPCLFPGKVADRVGPLEQSQG